MEVTLEFPLYIVLWDEMAMQVPGACFRCTKTNRMRKERLGCNTASTAMGGYYSYPSYVGDAEHRFLGVDYAFLSRKTCLGYPAHSLHRSPIHNFLRATGVYVAKLTFSIPFLFLKQCYAFTHSKDPSLWHRSIEVGRGFNSAQFASQAWGSNA
jgi:hypothetical protein